MSEKEQRYTTLRGGVRMPLVGLGTWRLHGRSAYDAVRYALDAGYRWHEFGDSHLLLPDRMPDRDVGR